MIILIGSQKGGCGKSTIAVNLSVALANQQKDVILVDSDRQGTASNWTADREENNRTPKVPSIQKYDNIKNTLLELGKRYEYVVVDTAGRDSRELRTGMLAADILIVPFRPSQPDLDTLPRLEEIITQAKDINNSLKTFAVLTLAPTNPVVNEVEEAIQYLEDYPSIKLLDVVIRDRKVYRDCMSFGQGVIEATNDKAKHEIETFFRAVEQEKI